MGTKDKRVDEYIANSEKFAQPILNHIRKIVHKACPEVTETLKWNFPHFEYKGILCSMASFKAHCAFGFWKAKVMNDPHKILEHVGKTAMGTFGRVTSVDDLPGDKILAEYIKEAMRLNDEDVKVVNNGAAKGKTKAAKDKTLDVPDYFLKALKKNKKALATFETFSYSAKKDYVEWVTEAKTETTRKSRLETAIEWMSEGKMRHWKYQKK